jgi:hypothetical protein
VTSTDFGCRLFCLVLFVFCLGFFFAAEVILGLSNPVSSTNKTDCHDVTEILLKVALNTIA